MSAVAVGFAEPVLAAQTTFRTVMDALARPGSVRRLAGVAAPAPLSPSAAAIALTLLDYETPFWLDAPLAGAPEVVRFRLRQHRHGGAPAGSAVAWKICVHAEVVYNTRQLESSDVFATIAVRKHGEIP